MNRSLPFRRRLAGAAALSLSWALMTGPALAQAGDIPSINIPAAPLGDALRAFSDQTGIAVIFTEALVRRQVSGGVESARDPEAALASLLAGTDLEAVPGAGGYVIRIRRSMPESAPAGLQESPAPTKRVVPGPSDERQTSQEDDLRIGQVTVTGTSLRGIAPESSPLQIYSREDILGSGVTTTEQFIRTLPQNFGGGSTDFVPRGLPGDYNSTSNNTNGTGANLRGLGSRGTLILLNGNRLAPSSTVGDYVDVSLIPVSALERVDVLTDGASSIYGGDAVAGVMNFVLRDDFQGAETSLRYGSVTSGSMEEYRISQTLGTSWDRGNVLGTVEIHDRDNLPLGDRPGIGGLIGLNGQPIPSGERLDLFPAQNRTSGVVALRQTLTDRLEVSGTALYSDRAGARTYFQTSSTLAPLQRSETESENFTLALGGDFELTRSWLVSLNSNFSRVRSEDVNRLFSTPDPEPVVYRTQSDLLSFDLRATGDVFALPGGIVRGAAGVHYREEEFSNRIIGLDADSAGKRDVVALYGEVQVPVIGPDNARPGFQRLELNLSGRLDDYSDFGSRTNPKIGLLWSPLTGLNIRSSYGQSFSPPPLGRTGALDRSAIIVPYTFIRNALGIALPDPSLQDVNYIFSGGTRPDLRPETSESLTLGFDYQRHEGPTDWTVKSSYYRIAFDDRINRVPVPGNLNGHFAPSLAFDDPRIFPPGTVVFFPTAAQVSEYLATLNRPPQIAPGASTDNIGIINNILLVQNVASTLTDGIDAQIGIETETGAGRFRASLNANYIFSFRQQAGPSTPDVDVLNSLYNPVDLQLRGQLGMTRGATSANLFVNYTDAYQTDSTPGAARIPSWTTLDLSLSHALTRFSREWPESAVLSLSVINLFDSPPPSTPANRDFRITGFDPANASPLGRFVAAEIRLAF